MLNTYHQGTAYNTSNAMTGEFNRVEMQLILVRNGGFDAHQAKAIYHEHVAPLDYNKRMLFVSMVYTGDITVKSKKGQALLKTTRGL